MKYRQLVALTTATVLVLSTAACGAKDIEDAPAGIQIETLQPEAEVQDSVDQRQQQAQEAQAPAEQKESEKTEETKAPQGPLKPELVAGSAPKLPIRVSFPDWKGYTDNTLAMNSMYSFKGYHGQGELFLTISGKVESFDMFVNGMPVDTSEITSLGDWKIDISSVTKNGENTVQVSNIVPSSEKEAVIVGIPYPEVIAGTPEEEGIHPEALKLISDLIETDIENGFTSAQLAVVRNGRLVYENAWGKTNTYQPNGLPNTDSPNVTTDTLYDLASVTKMFSVNYAIQKLVTDGEVDLDDKITKFLGDEFVTETIQVTTDSKGDPKDPASLIDLDTLKKWKSELTIRELLKHQGGFPADPKYCAPKLYKDGLKPGEDYPENPLFAGNVPSEETKQATVEMICKTPLDYEPGTKTVYSDADYMILGLVVEKVTGQDLDTYLKKTFYEPMGLTHITYNPLRNGFSKDDCAATELNGNTRDGLLNFEGYRTKTIQGEVHDEKAFYSMDGISGHAGLFSNATDLAKLASVMLTGGYGELSFFSPNIIDMFTSPKEEDAANWGLGWWRQGEDQRVWYFGTQSESGTFGHQGWTGTIVMIDPERDLVIAYLTNKKNSRVTNVKKDANKFDGDWYTSATLGFVPEILSIGMDADVDITQQLKSLTKDMAVSAKKILPKGVSIDSSHPAAKSARSKQQLAEKYE
ncbi:MULTISPECIES: penicillin binding protein PBP4B [unclassified Butyrivibrio]|uniref:penicillin binding protein PBP4B n=1 Tax=unclassified Butyrivibrio TaxID=2639466 RepID=UPI0003B44003|nr:MULTISPECIES: penicillin binding protein PBP4B [unclassified Butyrivibrio]